MADLDDFFAKKDKKKKTKKFPKANTDVLATKLEETARKEHQADMKAASAAMNVAEPENHAEGKDEEWKEYEEFKKDYSGLKIETLKIDTDNLPIGDDEETELNEDGEKVRVKKSDGGPWNKVAGQGQNKDDNIDTPPSSPEPQRASESAAPTSGPQKSAYVPPHLRGSMSSSSTPSSSGPSSMSKTQQRRNKAAPDISNEFNFPTLAAAVADGTPIKGSERTEAMFERVKSGGGQLHAKSAEGPRLTLDNKYAALRGDH